MRLSANGSFFPASINFRIINGAFSPFFLISLKRRSAIPKPDKPEKLSHAKPQSTQRKSKALDLN